MKHNLEIIENYKKKVLSNARAILTNQVAMPLGAIKMDKLVYWSHKTDALQDLNMDIFKHFADALNSCPIGTERLLWNKEALKEQDRIIEEITKSYRDQIIDKCFEIIQKFGDANK